MSNGLVTFPPLYMVTPELVPPSLDIRLFPLVAVTCHAAVKTFHQNPSAHIIFPQDYIRIGGIAELKGVHIFLNN